MLIKMAGLIPALFFSLLLIEIVVLNSMKKNKKNVGNLLAISSKPPKITKHQN